MTESLQKMNTNREKKIVETGPRFGKRHIQVILLFLLITIAYAMRVNLSVAIVAMTDNTTSINPSIPTYDWTDNSVILSSFYWGYICLQILAGKLGRTYGTKWFVVGAMIINSTAFMLIPNIAAILGSKGVIGCRVVQGLSQGFFYPSVSVLLGLWIPMEERSRLSTIVYSGLSISNIVTNPIAGYISASWVGWPATFFLFGGLGMFWILPWILFGSNSPAEHTSITEEERGFIQNSLGSKEDPKVLYTPWKAIATSLPTWSYVIANFGQAWGLSALLTEMPTYINKIMKFDIHSNSLLTAAPYAAYFILSYLCGYISDYIINNGYMSRTNSRKIFGVIGLFGPGISLIILGFIPEDAINISIAMLIFAVGLGGAAIPGYTLNAVDLSPRFSGVLTGIANGFSNIFSILSPLLIQVIVTDDTDKSQWRTVFIIAFAVYVATGIFFVIFASGDLQSWDAVDENDTKATTDLREKKVSTVVD